MAGAVDEAELAAAARAAAEGAYAPYSRFRVGAAVSAAGKIYRGANIENASYGLSICAERVAIFQAVADGARNLDAVAVACIDADASLGAAGRMPCGACRQVIAEFADPDLVILVDGAGRFRLDQLLAQPFTLRSGGSPEPDRATERRP